MRFVRPGVERSVRLAYCLNLHASDDFDAMLAGVEAITLPLRDRLGGRAAGDFGVGLYLPGGVASHLMDPAGEADFERLAGLLEEQRLDPVTFNAFPFGGFHTEGLKADVYRPTWEEESRARFTRDVAALATRLWQRRLPATRNGHISISTHPGAFGRWVEGTDGVARCATNMGQVANALAQVEAQGGPQIVLSVEAEPRASAGDSRALFAFLAFARAEAARALLEAGTDPALAHALPARHLGTCLDCCHSAVEFEDAQQALSLSTSGGPLGKLQFSSALALASPAEHPTAVELLLALDEPRYLHQVTGRAGARRARADDLPDLRQALREHPSAWLDCDEWRCHFHVPVDLQAVASEGTDLAALGTTRAHADTLLDLALADPSAWPTDELHVEIETYTWDVLPGAVRGEGDLIDGLEREYAHVLSRLAAAGWTRAPA